MGKLAVGKYRKMDDWENEDFEPTVQKAPAAQTDKWEGEDEDDDVKDNWEDEDEEKTEESTEGKAYQRPKKKPLADRIAEKNAAKLEAEKAKAAQNRVLTAEEKLAEKIRLQKIQEEADLKNAKELFGVSDGASKGIDSMYPETKEQFDEFSAALKNKITFFESSKLYGEFMEKFINDVSVSLPVDSIKKIGIALNSLYHEKDRLRKEQAKSKKKKQKATIRVDKTDDLGLADGTGAYYNDDVDDDFI